MTKAIDRQATFSGTRPVADALAIDTDRLETYLKSHIPGFSGPLSIAQFKGGQSNPTYLLTAHSGAYVLRRKPPGNLLPSAHAVDREYRVISALGRAGYPVPKAFVLCEDETVIGTMFYVMERVEGRVIWEPSCPGLQREQRAAIFDRMNATLARLHSFDPNQLGLGDFGRPDGYIARQIARWSRQYRASATTELPDMERLMEYLPDQVPDSPGASVVHGDYRLDNLILAADGPNIRAVLDWELSTLGDPLGDFTYHLMQWAMPPSADGSGVGSLVGHDLDALGIPSLETYVEQYCDRTGRNGVANLDYYLAYNFFRMAAIFQGILGRVRDGTATSENAQSVASQVAPMAETAWRFAERAGATT